MGQRGRTARRSRLGGTAVSAVTATARFDFRDRWFGKRIAKGVEFFIQNTDFGMTDGTKLALVQVDKPSSAAESVIE